MAFTIGDENNIFDFHILYKLGKNGVIKEAKIMCKSFCDRYYDYDDEIKQIGEMLKWYEKDWDGVMYINENLVFDDYRFEKKPRRVRRRKP